MENYNYQVDEKSLSQTALIRYVWNPILDILPTRLTPNTITLTGFVFMLTSALFAWFALSGKSWAFLLVALFLFLYMACDNVDGMHARRTGQSSALGEFLDHWLDSISFIVINACCAFAFHISGWILLVYFIFLGLAFFLTIWEQYHTGVFYSAMLGTNEGLLLLMGLYFVLFLLPGHSWIIYQPGQFSLALILALSSIIISGWSAIRCLQRVKKHFEDVLPVFAVMVTIALGACHGHITYQSAAILILGCNALACGRLTVSHLVKEESPYRNVIMLLIAIIGGALLFVPDIPTFVYHYIVCGGSTLLVLAVIWDGTRAIRYFCFARNREGEAE